jgi:hypothetical protein
VGISRLNKVSASKDVEPMSWLDKQKIAEVKKEIDRKKKGHAAA